MTTRPFWGSRLVARSTSGPRTRPSKTFSRGCSWNFRPEEIITAEFKPSIYYTKKKSFWRAISPTQLKKIGIWKKTNIPKCIRSKIYFVSQISSTLKRFYISKVEGTLCDHWYCFLLFKVIKLSKSQITINTVLYTIWRFAYFYRWVSMYSGSRLMGSRIMGSIG